jgi:hypothetical protein
MVPVAALTRYRLSLPVLIGLAGGGGSLNREALNDGRPGPPSID